MKIVTIADQHGNLADLPPCDLLLIAGDICPRADHTYGFQLSWLEAGFIYWAKRQQAKKIILVAGNHDFILERSDAKQLLRDKVPNLVYLEDDYCYYEDYKIYGSPWQPYNGGWAFNLYEEDLAKKYAQIPHDAHIIVSHGPPFGYGDKTPRKHTDDNETSWPEPVHSGSPSLTKRIEEINPKLVVFGHIHQGFGTYKLGDSILVNCACKPVELTLPPIKP